jgi:hypothetical protein
MITENWAGVAADLGNQIKTMMEQNGVVYNKCPLPAQTLAIKDYVLHRRELTIYIIRGEHANNYRSLFVLLYFFSFPLCCLFFFDIRILITL